MRPWTIQCSRNRWSRSNAASSLPLLKLSGEPSSTQTCDPKVKTLKTKGVLLVFLSPTFPVHSIVPNPEPAAGG